MTLRQIIDDCMKRTGEGDKNRFSDDDWIRWVNQGAHIVAVKSLCLKRTTDILLYAHLLEYDLPPDLWKIYCVFYGTSRLTELPMEKMLKIDSQDGDPKYYSIWGDTLHLDAVPLNGGEISLVYYAKPEDLTINDLDIEPEIPAFYHPLLVTYACYRMKQSDQAVTEASMLYQEFLRELSEAMADCALPTKDGPVWVEDIDGDFYE